MGTLLGCTAAPAGSVQTPNPSVAPPPPAPVSDEAAVHELYHASELRPGDCIEPMPTDFMITVVPCTVPHAAEFATTYVVPDGPWPGAVALIQLGQEGCEPRMRYVPSRREEVDVVALPPAEEDWPRYRTAYCLAIALDGQKLVGRVIL